MISRIKEYQSKVGLQNEKGLEKYIDKILTEKAEKKSFKSKIAEAESEENSYKNLKNVLTTNISKAYLNLKLNKEKIISLFPMLE